MRDLLAFQRTLGSSLLARMIEPVDDEDDGEYQPGSETEEEDDEDDGEVEDEDEKAEEHEDEE